MIVAPRARATLTAALGFLVLGGLRLTILSDTPWIVFVLSAFPVYCAAVWLAGREERGPESR